MISDIMLMIDFELKISLKFWEYFKIKLMLPFVKLKYLPAKTPIQEH